MNGGGIIFFTREQPLDSQPVILITGASSGIGAATARCFASEGYQVVLAARRTEKLRLLSEEIQSQGGSAMAVEADVTDLDQIHQLVETTLDHCGQINILFNNAGVGRMNWLQDLDPRNDVAQQLGANLNGLIWMTQAVLPHMLSRKKGQIINMASMASWIGTPTYSIYAASKFGVRGFSEALRRELAFDNIHISVIYPGGVATEFAQKAGIRRKTGATTPGWLRLSAEDVAEAVLGLSRRPRRSLVIPWQMHLVIWANALFPGLLDWGIQRWFVSRERKANYQ